MVNTTPSHGRDQAQRHTRGDRPAGCQLLRQYDGLTMAGFLDPATRAALARLSALDAASETDGSTDGTTSTRTRSSVDGPADGAADDTTTGSADGSTDKTTDATTGAVALEQIRGIRSLVSALESSESTTIAVRNALAAGESWEAIATAAGLKPAAAKWRWHGTDEEIAARHESGRKRSARPSSVPTDLPGMSVSEAARSLGVSAQAIYLRVSRGQLRSETVTLDDGRTYKRVFPEVESGPGGAM
jgi:hypothetical protein